MATALAFARYACRALRAPQELKHLTYPAVRKRMDQWISDLDLSERRDYLKESSEETVRGYLVFWLRSKPGKIAIKKMSTYLGEGIGCEFSQEWRDKLRDYEEYMRFVKELKELEMYLYNTYEHGQ